MSDDILLSIPRYGPLPADIYNDELFVRNIRHLHKELSSIIDLEYGLLDEMFSVSVLSDEEIAIIRCEKTLELMNQRMLEKLVSVYPDRVGRFMACLQRTLQIHVFNYIRYKGVLEKSFNTDVWPLSDEHKNRLKTSFQHLVDFVVPDIAFVNELHSSQVITTRHKQHVDICNTSAERNRTILEFMDRRAIADLKNYVNCLIKTSQEHLVPLLTQNTATAELHAELGIAEDTVDEAITEIVTEFDLLVRKCNLERNEQDLVNINEELKGLGDEVRLIALQKSTSLTVYILCLTLTSAQQLREVYSRGELKSILGRVFTILLRSKSVVNVTQLEWSTSNYDDCLQLLQQAPGWSFMPSKGGVPVVAKSHMNGGVAAIVIAQLIVKSAWLLLQPLMKLSAHASNTVLTTLGSVCGDWRRVMNDVPLIGKLVHRRNRRLCYPFRCHPKSVSSPQIVDSSSVRGVAKLANRLYVICRASDVIQVFDDRAPYRRHAAVRVSGMRWPRDIAACCVTNRLYVVDSANKCILRVDDPKSNCRVTRWTGYKNVPHAVSVRRGLVLVTPNVFFHQTLRLCDGNGELVVGVELPDYMEPRHAVETSRLTFFVCHTGRGDADQDQVSEIDRSGVVVRTFGGQRGGTLELLRFPRSLAVDAGDYVLVADSGNRRVQQLDAQLRLHRVLLDCDNSKLDGEPNRLCFDHETGQLIVGFRSSFIKTFIVK